jgi:hypothetical protein
MAQPQIQFVWALIHNLKKIKELINLYNIRKLLSLVKTTITFAKMLTLGISKGI